MWIRLVESEKTVRNQWWLNAKIAFGQVIIIPLTVPAVPIIGMKASGNVAIRLAPRIFVGLTGSSVIERLRDTAV